MNIELKLGDCLEVLKTIPDNSIDSVVTDPPYGLEFMGKEWDSFIQGGGTGWKAGQMADTQSLPDGNSFKEKGFGKLPVYRGMNDKQKMTFQEFSYNWARECYRVLKPGGHLLAFGGSRMYHRLACGVEDAGFEIRDQIMWVYGSGFPKSHNIGKAIDKIEGNEREVIGRSPNERINLADQAIEPLNSLKGELYITKGNSAFEGWGTALKPAHEPIVMARKPLSESSIAENVLKHGTGGINIDGSRIGNEEIRINKYTDGTFDPKNNLNNISQKGKEFESEFTNQGRFPANIIFDEEAGKLLDEQTGELKQGYAKPHSNKKSATFNKSTSNELNGGGYNDKGGASRFFYCPKASKKDRNEGCDKFEAKPVQAYEFAKSNSFTTTNTKSGIQNRFPSQNNHPTVKPTDLMRYLINLITPPNGTVLDPFMGSGSTGKAAVRCGVNFIGIEKEQEYMDIAKARIEHEKNK